MPKKMHFSTFIDAPREAVWHAMLDPEPYKAWTSEFAAGSYYEGSWEQGSRIRFLGPDGTGMLAEIAENRPLERVSVRHLGMVGQGGVEDTESDEVKKWAPAYENYTLSDSGTGTLVEVEMDVTPDWETYMAEAWPKALARLKGLSEERQKEG